MERGSSKLLARAIHPQARLEAFLRLAKEMDTGFILDTVTWKAHAYWGRALGASSAELRAANEDGVRFIAGLRNRFVENPNSIVLNAVIGPRGDAYRPEAKIAMDAAEEYFAEQLGWLAGTEADMVTALTFNQASEAAGLVRAARSAGLPVVVSFTVETNGALPDGQSLAEAITRVDEATDGYTAYFMINCAHPEHFAPVLGAVMPNSIQLRNSIPEIRTNSRASIAS